MARVRARVARHAPGPDSARARLFRHVSAVCLSVATKLEAGINRVFPLAYSIFLLYLSATPPGFIPYSGDGYAFLLPSKYNPTRERPFPNCDAYFEDNFDAVSNISVIVEKTNKSKIEDFGSPEMYLEQIGYLLGQQVYAGETRSEGGFAANRVSTAAVLDVFTKSNKGKTYYYYEVLTRTADGDEGGRHQLIAATVSDGTMYTCKLQSGDKRWFKGQERDLKQTWSSFTVA